MTSSTTRATSCRSSDTPPDPLRRLRKRLLTTWHRVASSTSAAAPGALLAVLRQRVAQASGLEYSNAALAHCRRRGLTVRQFDLERAVPTEVMDGADVVVLLEVAEHLPETFAGDVHFLRRAGRAVVFTAATPGQGGTDHVNEQPHEYWIAKFARRGFHYDSPRADRWRSQWRQRDVAWFYCNNLMIFLAPRRSRMA